MGRGATMVVAALVAGAFAPAVSCRAPTQVSIVVRSRLRCDEITYVAITVASTPARASADFVYENYAALAGNCRDGEIGALLIIPGSVTGAVQVVVGAKALLGSSDVRDCVKKPEACIVARRRFRFVDGESLRIPIVLDPDCTGVGCPQLSTCRAASCVDSEVSSCTGEEECRIPDDAATMPGVRLGDAGMRSDASASLSDGGSPPDGGLSSDGGSSSDGSTNDGGGGYNMYCRGPSHCGTACAIGQICCRQTLMPYASGCYATDTCSGSGMDAPSCCDGHCAMPGLYCGRFSTPNADFQCQRFQPNVTYYCKLTSDCPPSQTCVGIMIPDAIGLCTASTPQ